MKFKYLIFFSANEAASILQKRGILQQYGVPFEMLIRDTQNNFRTFTMLEKLLQTPTRLPEQILFQITPETQRFIIEK